MNNKRETGVFPMSFDILDNIVSSDDEYDDMSPKKSQFKETHNPVILEVSMKNKTVTSQCLDIIKEKVYKYYFVVYDKKIVINIINDNLLIHGIKYVDKYMTKDDICVTMINLKYENDGVLYELAKPFEYIVDDTQLNSTYTFKSSKLKQKDYVVTMFFSGF